MAASAQISVRLTTANREAIAKAMLANRFAKETEALLGDRAVHARAVYADVYKPKDRKFIESAPKGWLPESAALKIKFGTDFAELHFDGHHHRMKVAGLGIERKAVNLPIAYKHVYNVALAYETSHKLAKAWEALEVRRRDLETSIATAERQLTAALASASTTGRLKEIWPEATPFCKEIEKASPPLPALPTKALNDLLGLPIRKSVQQVAA